MSIIGAYLLVNVPPAEKETIYTEIFNRLEASAAEMPFDVYRVPDGKDECLVVIQDEDRRFSKTEINHLKRHLEFNEIVQGASLNEHLCTETGAFQKEGVIRRQPLFQPGFA